MTWPLTHVGGDPGPLKQWKDIPDSKPCIITGIQSAANVHKAVEVGVDGIVVSNHARRHVDGAIASLDALKKIVGAVGEKTYVSNTIRVSSIFD